MSELYAIGENPLQAHVYGGATSHNVVWEEHWRLHIWLIIRCSNSTNGRSCWRARKHHINETSATCGTSQSVQIVVETARQGERHRLLFIHTSFEIADKKLKEDCLEATIP